MSSILSLYHLVFRTCNAKASLPSGRPWRCLGTQECGCSNPSPYRRMAIFPASFCHLKKKTVCSKHNWYAHSRNSKKQDLYRRGKLQMEEREWWSAKSSRRQLFLGKNVEFYGELPSTAETWLCSVDREDFDGESIYLIYLYLMLLPLSSAVPMLLFVPLDFPRHMMDLGLWSENSGGQSKSNMERVLICHLSVLTQLLLPLFPCVFVLFDDFSW